MTKEPPQDWHRPGENAVTLRLPESYSGILEWAEPRGLSDALEIIYLSIGGFADPRAIISLRNWVANEAYQGVWQDWSDHPTAFRLHNFFCNLDRHKGTVTRAESVYPLQGGAVKTKRHFSKQGCPLLAPIIYLSQHRDSVGSPELTRRYRLLMWVFVQSARRVLELGGGADHKITKITHYLTDDSTSKNWASVDRLLRRVDNSLAPAPITYDRFTSHLQWAVELAKPPPGADRSLASFLHDLSDISQGQWGEDDKRSAIQWQKAPARYSGFAPIEPEAWVHEELGDWTPLEQSEPGAEDDAVEDDPPEAILLPVDPDKTPLEQTLTSQAVFLHSAEQSHFLPWSWDKLLPPEITQLEGWVEAQIDISVEISRTGAALVWVAMHAGRSLYHTNRIAISDKHGEEWTISPDFTRLQRLSPHRHNAWQPKTDAAAGAVKPSTDRLTFTLPDKITAALSACSSSLQQPPSNLWDLWQSVSPTEKIEVWFDRQAREHFPRVTSGKLEQVAAQRIFNQTGDDHLARLLVAPPRSGLPAACGYSSWDMNAIAAGLPPDLTPLVGADASTLFLGSLLAPLEELLKQDIKEAGRKLSASLGEDLVSFHNRYSVYVVMALYAATGCRHLRSPFESIEHFSLEYSYVYINDKNDGGVHAGRLVPLPHTVITILKQYLGYLALLAGVIEHYDPALAKDIETLPAGGTAIPLFFLLGNDLKWHQMSDADLPGVPLFEWPLPPNLFRHRYSQQMAALGVETDVIDGWMGHAERAVATYGDFSPRCWADDAKLYKATVDACFDGLGFRPLFGVSQLPPYRPPDAAETNGYTSPIIFGEAERQQERRLHRKRSTQRALIEIDEFLDGKTLESLTEDEFEALSKRILLRRNGLPYADAANRYRVLERKVRRLGSQCTRKIRTRYAQFSAEKSLVTAEIVPAHKLWRPLLRWRQKTHKAVNKSQMSRPEALCVGMLLFCLEKRISYKRLVFDGLQGKHFRLVQHKKRFYFEYSEEWDTSDFSVPTQRHEVSYKVASLLAFGQGLKSSVEPAEKCCPKRTQGLVTLLFGEGAAAEDTMLDGLFERLLPIIQQINLAMFPGMVAAALSERRPTTSLPWQDVLRITDGKPRVPPGLAADKTTDAIEGLRINQGIPLNIDQIKLQDEAKKYTKQLLHLIKGYVPSKSLDCAKAIDKVSNRYAGKTSTAILMLGYWLAHRIRQGIGRGKHHKPYAQSSVERYLIELRRSFEGILYDKDLLQLDGDQITDLYGDMLEACRASGKRIDYFSRRLKEFHRWAESIGCESVDWGELDTDDNVRSVSPGCLGEKDYVTAQRIIATQFPKGSDEALFLGFVLMLTFRFGLRFSEATGLRRNDWCHYQDDLWVLVHNNYLRKLKRPSSRRAIPLLFSLTEQEQRLIDAVLARQEALSPAGENTPILCDASGGQAILSSKAATLSKTLVQILRSATGNPQIRLHHCRHSFYNVVASILLPIDSEIAKALRKEIDSNGLKQKVLGNQNGTSRRTGMALARLMGHHRPDTGLLSYNHLLFEWADTLTPVQSERIHVLESVHNTSSFEIVATDSPPVDQNSLDLPPPDLARVFRALRLVACGKSYESAGKINLLPTTLIQDIQTTFTEANAKMRFKVKGGAAWFLGETSQNALLHYVSDTAWLRIMEHAESFDLSSMNIGGLEYPSLVELPAMTGMNRHILMSHQRHANLAALVLKLFEVPSTAFDVFYAKQDADIASIMRSQGWEPLAVEDKKTSSGSFQLDILNIVVEQKDDKRGQRGGIILERNGEGLIRTSFDLAVVVLALGVFINMLKDASSDSAVKGSEPTELEQAALVLMMEVPEAAERWLNTPIKILDSMTPKEYAEQHGDQRVLDLIARLREGLLS